jgi:hypothetical protein
MIRNLTSLLLVLLSVCSSAQEQNSNFAKRFINIGVGASGWGIPIHISLDIPLSKEYQFVSIGVSRQSQSEVYDYGWLQGETYTWKHVITGVHASWNMNFDEYLYEFLPEELQVYVGGQMDYYVWKTKLVESSNGQNNVSYSGESFGGIGVSGIVGGRYFFGKRKGLALNVVLGGGTRSSSGRIGLSMNLGDKK